MTLKTILLSVSTTGLLLPALTSLSQAATLTSTASGVFNDAATWVGSSAPVSGVDSVSIGHGVNLSTEFIIASGQSMVGTANLLRIGNGGHLIVATGGTLDYTGFNIAEDGAGGHLTIESGATVSMDRYWNDEASPSYTNTWIASATGVTTMNVTGSMTLRGTDSILEVDLTNYDLSNGTTLVLVDYGSLNLQSQAAGDNGWGTINLTDGWTADLDLTTGGQIRLINIANSVVPEPSSAALLALSSLAVLHRRRR